MKKSVIILSILTLVLTVTTVFYYMQYERSQKDALAMNNLVNLNSGMLEDILKGERFNNQISTGQIETISKILKHTNSQLENMRSLKRSTDNIINNTVSDNPTPRKRKIIKHGSNYQKDKEIIKLYKEIEGSSADGKK